MPKPRPDDSAPSIPVEIVHQVGTLCFKTVDSICVMNSIGDFWYLEFRPDSVQARWREGLLVKVYFTNEFRKKVVAMEECLDDPPLAEAPCDNTQSESA